MPAPNLIREFRSCINDAADVDVTPGEGNYRIGLTKKELFKWAKRPRRWSISGVGGSAEIGSASGPDVFASVSGVTSEDGGEAFSSESEFTCADPVLASQSINSDNQTNSEGGFARARIEADFSIFDPNLFEGTKNRFIVYDSASGLFYPYINLTWRAICENDGPGGKEISSNITDVEEGSEGSMGVTIFGKNLTFYWTTISDTDGAATPITSLIVSPGLFWAYNPNDGGGPVVDTGTGEILRQP